MIEMLASLLDPRVSAPIAVVLLLLWNLRVVNQYERGVLFRLGRVAAVRGPGLVLLVPFADRLRKVDLRVVSVDVARQETMTRDNVPTIVDAVVFYRVVDPGRSILEVEDAHQSTYLIAQTSLRSVIGQTSLDDLLSRRDVVNQALREIVDRQTLPWGVEVPIVEIKDVSLPEEMKRAMAREAETERERRARLIQAEGEAQSAEKLREAARVLAEVPAALHLRTLQALAEAAQGRGRTLVLPIPSDWMLALRPGAGAAAAPAPAAPATQADPKSGGAL